MLRSRAPKARQARRAAMFSDYRPLPGEHVDRLHGKFAAKRGFGLSAPARFFGGKVSDPQLEEELKQMVAQPLERVNVRSRASQVTRSAWRLEANSPAGSGAILLLELSAEESFYRGEGIFLGWSQERLARAYEALAPKSAESGPELPQLG